MQKRNIKRNGSVSNGQLNKLKQEVKLNDSKEFHSLLWFVIQFLSSTFFYEFPPHHRQTIIT